MATVPPPLTTTRKKRKREWAQPQP
ncbi:hypothetical protein CCACVL1_05262 [Corchorus capsularis]|uniref:Uncharacterized protein n=1 Tax=Corchorus capsularis TaxID=210143 RepID=A0A1R3JLR7_COCAP|nr:hypothetical protein CCACVL1_05262 [Corchorus capsularis]